MDAFKSQIQRQLVANLLKEKCASSEHIVFRDAWCTQERVIRFTTPFWRKLLGVLPEEGGKWKTGDIVMYEVINDVDSVVVECVLAYSYLSGNKKSIVNVLLERYGVAPSPVVLQKWDLTRSDGDVNLLMDDFDRLINKDIPLFEQSLGVSPASSAPEELLEGEAETIVLNKYERNIKAREACIAYYGATCAVCGMSFEKTYGPEFAGMIEVHHIVPISSIGKEYVVDPIKDLVPVCPNCHFALHSKKDGVYMVDELKEMMGRDT